jgi:pyruvate dehydrogenase E1 component beta subunit
VTYRDAMRAAIREALERDERVFLMGEDVGRYGGCFAVTKGLLDEFGPERVRDTPLSESAFVGAGIGAAMGGMRPIVEIMTVNFSLLALDQIVNNAATITHMSGGQLAVPLVIRMTTGAGRQLAAQHSHSLEGWYAHIPGLRILTPATLEDARGMLWPALCDPSPVIVFEHGALYNMEGELREEPVEVDIESASVRRPGSDVSLIAYGGQARAQRWAARLRDGRPDDHAHEPGRARHGRDLRRDLPAAGGPRRLWAYPHGAGRALRHARRGVGGHRDAVG